MKNIVVYESKYGFTKKYAEWIAIALSCDLCEKKSIKPEFLKDYDTIIYGGGLYAGGVSGIDLLTKNYYAIRDKNIVLFTCGLADTTDKDNIVHIKSSLSKVLSAEMQDKIKIFNLRGGIDYSKLSIVHKSMMAMLHKIMKSKDYSTLRNEDREMLNTYGKVVDFTDRESIKPIIDYVAAL